MSDISNIEDLTSLKERLYALDEKTAKATKFAKNDVEEAYTVNAMNILKLELIDAFIKNNCSHESISEAFEMYAQTAMNSIQLLMTISKDVE